MKNVIVSNIQTLPTRQNTMKKLRNRERAGVQRSFTIMNDGGGNSSRGGSFDASRSRINDDFDTRSVTSDAGRAGFEGNSSVRRKDKKTRTSFLKKRKERP